MVVQCIIVQSDFVKVHGLYPTDKYIPVGPWIPIADTVTVQGANQELLGPDRFISQERFTLLALGQFYPILLLFVCGWPPWPGSPQGRHYPLATAALARWKYSLAFWLFVLRRYIANLFWQVYDNLAFCLASDAASWIGSSHARSPGNRTTGGHRLGLQHPVSRGSQ
jgi:hypothetical protein